MELRYRVIIPARDARLGLTELLVSLAHVALEGAPTGLPLARRALSADAPLAPFVRTPPLACSLAQGLGFLAARRWGRGMRAPGRLAPGTTLGKV